MVGVDVNPAILETGRTRAGEAGLSNLEFIAGDARTLDLGGDFDALVGRLVLMYMADPAAALKQLATRVRPGGIVAFQEVDFTPYRQMHRPDTPVANKLIDWALRSVRALRGARRHGLRPLPHLRRRGPARALHALRCLRWESPQSWAGYSYIANGFRSLLPLIVEFGIATEEEVGVETLAERVRQEVVTAKRPLLLPPHVTAWAHIPT